MSKDTFYPIIHLIIDEFHKVQEVTVKYMESIDILNSQTITFLILCTLQQHNFACVFVVCRFFSKLISFKNTIRMSNNLHPDQARL